MCIRDSLETIPSLCSQPTHSSLPTMFLPLPQASPLLAPNFTAGAPRLTVTRADGKTCRYAVGVASGSRVVLEASSVQLADQAALRCGANAAVQLQCVSGGL
eukprot:2772405-Rhodomonas_salina.3